MRTAREQAHLQVDELHQIYYETYGNPNGTPVLFIHGGPGLGSSSKDTVFFDLEKINLILFDQRGTGKSLPKAALENNNTPAIINDINKLLTHLNIEQAIIFGGSWGACLSLLYAIQYPTRVLGLVLRGIFTASKRERLHFENGGAALFFPDVWRRFARLVPTDSVLSVPQYYFQNILEQEGEQRQLLSYELIHYGASVASKHNIDNDVNVDVSQLDYETRALILSHYSVNDFFLPDAYILNHLNVLAHMPIQIVHGQYDMITPPKTAITVARKLKNATLNLIDAGHSAFEPKMTIALQQALEDLLVQVDK